MKKQKVGLYLGFNSIGGVVVENRKVVSVAKCDLSSLEEEAKVENLNEEVKWEALINKTLRELGGVETRDVFVAMADRDFIFRSIEMPFMKKKEIESSLSYEIEKYVPFKLDELRWDYSYTSFSKEKKINISFVGIKDDKFKRTQTLFTRLDLNPVAVEPSSLSLVRIIKTMRNLAGLRNFAVLDFMETEAYLTFFYHDLPVFNRYFTVPKKEDIIDLDKFVEPVHLSYQYFKREFKDYQLDKFIVISNSPDEELLRMLKEDLQTEVEMLYPINFINVGASFVENLKALGVSSLDTSPYKFKPVLRKIEEQGAGVEVLQEVPLKPGLIAFVAILGILISAVTFYMKAQQLNAIKTEIQQKESELVLPSGQTWEKIQTDIFNLNKKVTTLKDAIPESKKELYPFLEKLSSFLPRGVWLEALDIDNKSEQCKGVIRGNIFLGDAYKEREAIDDFIFNLKKDPFIKEIFSSIVLGASQRVKEGEFEVTSFTVLLN